MVLCAPCAGTGIHQRLFYNGHKRAHALKYQSVTTPDGLILHLHGPVEGRPHSTAVLVESDLLQQLQQHMQIPGGKVSMHFMVTLRIHSPLYPYIQKGYQGGALTLQQRLFDRQMSSARQTVEWGFGEIATLWAQVDFQKQQKLLQQPIAAHYKVAAFLTNCRTIARADNKTSKYFNAQPPPLWKSTCSGLFVCWL